MKTLGTSVLTFQAIVLALFIPVAVNTGWGTKAGWVGFALIMLCVFAMGALRRSGSPTLGWAVQVLTIATGFIVPAMFGLGALFAALWWAAVKYGRQADTIRAEQLAASKAPAATEAATDAAPDAGPRSAPASADPGDASPPAGPPAQQP